MVCKNEIEIYAKKLCTAEQYLKINVDKKEEMKDNYISMKNIFKELNLEFKEFQEWPAGSRKSESQIIANARRLLWKAFYNA